MASDSEVGVGAEVEKDLVPKMASHYDTLAEDAGKDDNRKKLGQKAGKNQGSAEKGKGGKEGEVHGVREKVSSAKEVAGKTLGSAKDAVTGLTEKTKELVFGKTEDEGRRDPQEELREEQERHGHEEVKTGGILGAVGEALVEIAVSTRDLVFGKGKADDWDVVYDLGYGGRAEPKQQDEK